MKTFLVTGGAGFIGSHLCDYILNKKQKVIALDNLLTGSLDNIKHNFSNEKFSFINHDVCNYLDIDEKINYILHFASTASPVDYLKFPIKTLRIGSIGTENILKLGIKKNATVLVASTSEIYGDPQIHPQKESYYGNVNPVGPRSVYDEAKRYLEAITIAYNNSLNLDVRIARIFNTYGPRMRVDDGRAVPNFINQRLNEKDFTIYGNGLQTRSFCFISDTVKGIYNLLLSNYSLPVNIGNPNEHSILNLIDIIKKITPSKQNGHIFLKSLEDDPKVRQPDIELANKILNWKPVVNLEDGLRKTINFYSNLSNFKK